MHDRFKFRVWVKDSEEYIEDEAGECHINHKGELICGDWVDDGYCGHYDYFNDDEVIVEQCTGLKDKNGKLIYEGDIVGYCYYDGTISDEKGIVKYGEFNCSCCDGVYGWYFDGSDIRYANDNYNEVIVLGNIHENPDLLENKDE